MGGRVEPQIRQTSGDRIVFFGRSNRFLIAFQLLFDWVVTSDHARLLVAINCAGRVTGLSGSRSLSFFCLAKNRLGRFPDIYIQQLVCSSFFSRVFFKSHVRTLSGRFYNRIFKRGGNDQAGRIISTSQLNVLLRLHRKPINVVVCHDPSGKSHLGRGLALRCFQRLSFPNIATQRCR